MIYYRHLLELCSRVRIVQACTIVCLMSCVSSPVTGGRLFLEAFDRWASSYAAVSSTGLLDLRERAREMFTFGYDNYMRYAFPLDELDPIHCVGRGPDYSDPSNININDALGDYSLTLVDALDTLAIMGNRSEFHRAVKLVIDYVSFEKDITVQVFEANIRVLGSLLSAHLLLTDRRQLLGDLHLDDYNDELLTLAHDLATRLLPAFDNTATGIPHPRVNFLYGVPWNTVNETCTAGAGSLLLEFGVLSRLLGDPTFEALARRTNRALWNLRDAETGLFGNTINIQTGEWNGLLSGLGAGVDSFYEYLLKAYILFSDREDYRMFNESYSLIQEHQRRGRRECNAGAGDPPLYVNVHMRDGSTANTWIDSLQASFAGVQILDGRLQEAICHHALFYSIWRKYGALPERFNWQLKMPDVMFYPLRPEFAESTYLLYQATKNPFYLHVGQEIMDSLNEHTRVRCGFATVHDVHDKTLEDRMESFFLSETCKYLYLLFDVDNLLNKHYDKFLFTTEGHVLPIEQRFREWPSFEYISRAAALDRSDEFDAERRSTAVDSVSRLFSFRAAEPRPSIAISAYLQDSTVVSKETRKNVTADYAHCESFPFSRRYTLPLQSKYLEQLYTMVGFDWGKDLDGNF